MRKGDVWGWTDERRAKQAAAIRQWQPWNKATGPRTAEGKVASARNAAKPNSRRRKLLAMKAELVEALRLVRKIEKKRRRVRRQT